MFSFYFNLGIISGIVSSVVGGIYALVYYKYMFDFSVVLPIWRIVAAYFSLGLIAGGALFVFERFSPKFGSLIFNLSFALLSFASILLPILKFIDGVEFPELFPGFAIPLHFFFPVIFLSLSPFIIKKNLS